MLSFFSISGNIALEVITCLVIQFDGRFKTTLCNITTHKSFLSHDTWYDNK